MMYQTVLLLTMAGGSVGNPPTLACQGPVVYEVVHQASVLDRLRAHFPRQPGCQGKFYSAGLFRRGHGHGHTVDATTPGCGGVVTGSSSPVPSGSTAPPSKLPASAAPSQPSVPQPASPPAQPQKKVAAALQHQLPLETASRADRLLVAAPNRE